MRDPEHPRPPRPAALAQQRSSREGVKERTVLARLVVYTASIMWIVRLALRRPYTFVVLALLIAVMGVLSMVTMPVDIFPRINIPVISVIWTYGSPAPTSMRR
jgi:hypothetical protein